MDVVDSGGEHAGYRVFFDFTTDGRLHLQAFDRLSLVLFLWKGCRVSL